MSIYTNPPEWEDAGKKPPSSKRTEGWKPGDRVPASWLNWFWFSTVNSLREIAQAFVDHRDASAPHDGHETKDGATAKVEAHSSKTTGVHGAGAGFYVAKTARADQRVGWDDVVDKPTAFPAAAHNHDNRYYTKAQVDQMVEGLGESSKTPSGYVWLPGGLLLQWGRSGHMIADSSATVNFPIPFPNQCFQVVATKLNSITGDDDVFCVVRNFNNTSVTFKMEKSTFGANNYIDGRYAIYFAIGY